ncbi:type VII secretion system-associated protein [Rugosimonospora acidiphila]
MSEERNWMLLLDTDWEPPAERDADAENGADGGAGAMPAAESIVGGWLVDDGGAVGPFEPNPLYLPTGDDAPSGPVDAAAKLVAAGVADASLVLLAMRDSLTDLALDEAGEVIVEPAPDGQPCVLVATGATDQTRVAAPGWRQVGGAELVGLLPDGVDVLLNPGGPRAMRLFAGALRDALAASARPA